MSGLKKIGTTKCFGGPWDGRQVEILATERGEVLRMVPIPEDPADLAVLVNVGTYELVYRFMQRRGRRTP